MTGTGSDEPIVPVKLFKKGFLLNPNFLFLQPGDNDSQHRMPASTGISCDQQNLKTHIAKNDRHKLKRERRFKTTVILFNHKFYNERRIIYVGS